MANAIAGIVMGSTSDWETMKAAAQVFEQFAVAYEAAGHQHTRVQKTWQTGANRLYGATNASINRGRQILIGDDERLESNRPLFEIEQCQIAISETSLNGIFNQTIVFEILVTVSEGGAPEFAVDISCLCKNLRTAPSKEKAQYARGRGTSTLLSGEA